LKKLENLNKELIMKTNKNKKVKSETLPPINYYEYINGEAGGLLYPPLPIQLQKSLDLCLNAFGKDSYEFIVLTEDIVFIENKWIRMYMVW
jgi:hypothetical protein